VIEKTLTVMNEVGIHARAAAKITGCCRKYSSRIEAIKNESPYDLKNVMKVIMLNEKRGETLLVEFDGDDEENAASELEELFARKFHEK
jgi:phosphotransferase system HPr (HPr) family protein